MKRLPVYIMRAVLFAMCAVIVLAGGILATALRFASKKEIHEARQDRHL